MKDLNGLTYNDFPASLQIRVKRAFIRVEVVRKETDPRFKYHMFKRLNTGGEILSAQEVRNCTIRLLDSKFPDFVIQLSNDDAFRECTSALTEERKLTAFDQELVLRFFALKNRREKFRHDVSDFLTEYMQDVADPQRPEHFDYSNQKARFISTFEALQKTLSDHAFAFANRARNDLSAGFSIYHFEAITIGLQAVLDRLDLTKQCAVEKLREVLRSIKLDGEFIELTTGGGKNSPGLLSDRIRFVEKRLTDAFPG